MSLTTGAKGNRNTFKQHFMKSRAVGERQNAAHFAMSFDGFDDLNIKVSSTQLPAMERELIESYGAMGTMQNFQGNWKNAGEITVVIEETIKGDTLATLRNIIYNKLYVDVTVDLTPEDIDFKASTSCRMLECSLMCDVVELANESVTELVKPSVTLRYNFVEWDE